jgi:hypothetical protein
MGRQADLDRFYTALAVLRAEVGGERYLATCENQKDWPRQGIYFFFEAGETREYSHELRVVRVGTHAVSANSRTTLWHRLRAHRGSLRGQYAGGGNHRGSIFRLHVGSALLNRFDYPLEIRKTWGIGSSAPAEIKMKEHDLEKAVSSHIGSLPFLWLKVEDAAGPSSMRRYIERNSIGLLSNFNKTPIDPASLNWLGHFCANSDVRMSGLWNVDCIEHNYDPRFLDEFEHLVDSM